MSYPVVDPLGTPTYVPPEEQAAAPPPEPAPVAAPPVAAAPVDPLGTPSADPAPQQAAPAAAPVEAVPVPPGGVPQPTYEAAPPPEPAAAPGDRFSGVMGAGGEILGSLGGAKDAALRLDPAGVTGALFELAAQPQETQIPRLEERSRERTPVTVGQIQTDPSVAIDVVPTAQASPSLVADDLLTYNPEDSSTTIHSPIGGISLGDILLPNGAPGALGPIGDAIGTALTTPIADVPAVPFGVAASVAGSEFDAWLQTHPGGTYEEWKVAGGTSPTPPKEWINPFEQEGSPLEQIGGAIRDLPATAGGVVESLRSGSAEPFAKSVGIDIFTDPLSVLEMAFPITKAGLGAGAARAGRMAAEATAVGNISKAARATQVRNLLSTGQTGVQLASTAEQLATGDPTALLDLGEIRRGLTAPTAEGQRLIQEQAQLTTTGSFLNTVAEQRAAGTAPTTPYQAVPPAAVTPGAGLLPPNGSVAPSPVPNQPAAGAPPYQPVAPGQVPPLRSTTRAPVSPARQPVSPTTGRPLASPEAQQAVQVALNKRLKELNVKGVEGRVVDNIADVVRKATGDEMAVWSPSQRLIAIAADAHSIGDAPRLIDHEAMHAIDDFGYWRAGERESLLRAAMDTPEVKQIVDATYADLKKAADPANYERELLAELYTAHRANPNLFPAEVRSILTRLADFLKALGGAVRETTPAEVLRRIDNGEVGRRSRQQGVARADAAARVYHGSGRQGITTLKADIPGSQRQYQQSAASTLGVFTTPHRSMADMYAGIAGAKRGDGHGSVYEADVELTNPYVMPFADFEQLISRKPEAFARADALKAELVAAGHDGIHAVGSDGTPLEIVSFDDVPVTAEDAFARRMEDAGVPTDLPPPEDAFARIRVFHGSPHTDLTTISADPPSRQHRTAATLLGAFTTGNRSVAEEYARATGRVYQADLELANPYHMPLADLVRNFEWEDDLARNDALDFKADLQAKGHGGIIAWQGEPALLPDGSPDPSQAERMAEIVSFYDIEDAFARRTDGEPARPFGTVPEPADAPTTSAAAGDNPRWHMENLSRLAGTEGPGAAGITDEMLQDLFAAADAKHGNPLSEAMQPGKSLATMQLPTADMLERALRLDWRDIAWYEDGAQGFHRLLDMPAEDVNTFFNLIAATSVRAEPKINMDRAISSMAEHVQGKPITTPSMLPGSVREAVRETHMSTPKFYNFSSTPKYLLGMIDTAPGPTLDLQVAHALGLADNGPFNGPVYDALSEYFTQMRDALNTNLAREAAAAGLPPPAPLQTWHLQAALWVQHRLDAGLFETGSSYAEYLDDALARFDAVGAPRSPDGKLTRETFMTPEVIDEFGQTARFVTEIPYGILPENFSNSSPVSEAQRLNRVLQETGNATTKGEYRSKVSNKFHKGLVDTVMPQLMRALTGTQFAGREMQRDVARVVGGNTEAAALFPFGGRAMGESRWIADPAMQKFTASALAAKLNLDHVDVATFEDVPHGQGNTYTLFLPDATEVVDEALIARLSAAMGYGVRGVNPETGGTHFLVEVGPDEIADFDQISRGLQEVYPGDVKIEARAAKSAIIRGTPEDYVTERKAFLDGLDLQDASPSNTERKRAIQRRAALDGFEQAADALRRDWHANATTWVTDRGTKTPDFSPGVRTYVPGVGDDAFARRSPEPKGDYDNTPYQGALLRAPNTGRGDYLSLRGIYDEISTTDVDDRIYSAAEAHPTYRVWKNTVRNGEQILAPVDRIPLDPAKATLVAGQSNVQAQNVRYLMDHPETVTRTQMPVALKDGDRYLVEDGHHRVAAARINGDESVPAFVFDVNEGRAIGENVGPDDTFARRQPGPQTREEALTEQHLTGAAREMMRRNTDPNATTGYMGFLTAPQTTLDMQHVYKDGFHFADGKRVMGKQLGETAAMLYDEVLTYIDMVRDPVLQQADPKEFDRLTKRLVRPDQPVDFAAMGGPGNLDRKRQLTVNYTNGVLAEAIHKAQPKNAKNPGAIAQMMKPVAEFTRVRAMVGLFNIANIPRYFLQNWGGNLLMTALRNPGAVPPYLERLTTLRKTAGVVKGTHVDMYDDLIAQAGIPVIPTVDQTDKAQLGITTTGKLPPPKSKLEAAARKVMNETATAYAQTADIGRRRAVAQAVLETGFQIQNANLPRIVAQNADGLNPVLPYRHGDYQTVVREFLATKSTRVDGNTGKMHTRLWGRPAKYTPVYTPMQARDAIRDGLLAIDSNVDRTSLNRAVHGIWQDLELSKQILTEKVRREVINSDASWIPTNISEFASQIVMYPYWTTTAGVNYLRFMTTHPLAAATYGRMLDYQEEQAEVLGTPEWMKSFFRVMNSPMGMTVWLNPLELLTTFFTFPEYAEGGSPDYLDLTPLGRGASDIPFMLNSLLSLAIYATGAGGADYRAPDVLGLGRLTGSGGALLNAANANGLLPSWMGKDAAGNPVPINTRPLEELTARFGHELSSRLQEVTGLTPVPVPNMTGGPNRDITIYIEQDIRRANPNLEQIEVNKRVTDVLEDPGSPEYQHAYQTMTSQALTMGGIDTPLPDGFDAAIEAALRLSSPIGVHAGPEQLMLDSRAPGMIPSGDTPPRNIPNLDSTDEQLKMEADAIYNDAKYGASRTLAAREFDETVTAYWDGRDPDNVGPIAQEMWGIYNVDGKPGQLTEPAMIGGVEWTEEELLAVDKSQRRALAEQYASEHGTSIDELAAFGDQKDAYDDEARKQDPFLGGYLDFRDNAKWKAGVEPEVYIQQTMAMNPAYGEWVMEHGLNDAGGIDVQKSLTSDAYLAAQGIPPSVYSPVHSVATMGPGGPVAPIAVAPADAPPTVRPTTDLNLRTGPDQSYESLLTLAPGTSLTVTEQQGEWTQVSVPGTDYAGWVATGFLQNGHSPNGVPGMASPSLNGTADASAAGSGLAAPSIPDQIGGALGGLVQGVGNAIGGLIGNPPQPEQPKTVTTSSVNAVEDTKYGLSPWADGGITQDLLASIVPGASQVGWDFREPVGADYYGNYFTPATGGHGTEHPGIDIWGDYGTPVQTPVAGTVVCTASDSGEGGVNGFGCAAFKDTDTGGVGKIEVQLDGKNQSLVFGHMQTSDVVYGQAVTPGTGLGGFGGMSGIPHVHLEARVWSPDGTYQIVDPTLMLSGYYD